MLAGETASAFATRMRDLLRLRRTGCSSNRWHPADAIEVIVNKTGQVFARIDGQTDLQSLGQLQIANFANEAGLAPLGDNLFQETSASGPANVGVPGDPGFATIEQGYLEASNVDPVKEITELISAQRAYEMNSKVIQAADDMASVVSKNIR